MPLKPYSVKSACFRRSASVFTGTCRVASIMPASRRTARKSNAPLKRRIGRSQDVSLLSFAMSKRQIDRSQRKLTLSELCERYIKTVQHQKPKTLKQKTYVVARIKGDWPTGSLVQVAKIKSSDVDLWLARFQLGMRRAISMFNALKTCSIWQFVTVSSQFLLLSISNTRNAKNQSGGHQPSNSSR